MTTLHIDEEESDIFLLNRKKRESESELEKLHKETIPDIPLSKALHLLANVHGQVFDKAISTIRQSSPLELSVKIGESPTVKALLSIESYLETNKFKHVYEPLKEKFLKRSHQHESSMRIIGYFLLYSTKHQSTAREFIYQELLTDNKRDQLAAVILLQQRSASPTLLSCSAYELSLNCCWYIYDRLRRPKIKEDKAIVEVEPLNVDQQLEDILCQTKKLIDIIQRWHTMKDEAGTLAYQEIGELVASLKNNSVKSTTTLEFIATYLVPRLVLHEKPLSQKRQESILSYKEGTSSVSLSAAKILLLLIVQNGHYFKTPQELTALKDKFEKEYNRVSTLGTGTV
ncbi:hypothetical protein G6F70_002347 [Rhizopus microsporus]|nr:hypothetical protein G6F71_004500 [Rhizopus microsporus]KAG1202356.1 hypothetical protein G6F70_002347 [Rhizopus microsporus]KAG1214131.1 hypothetical protein G6F69_002214 [Rhizopus microsporus]KAG1236517.1 hypothetical protein G6F67_001942 [Rhizopus microsporus]KAG1265554.1 hypothetical protein G6F68_003481 [Rhizopus microsporus]